MAKSLPKLDIFTHILPDKYRKTLYSKTQHSPYSEGLEKHHNAIPGLFDIGFRIGTIEKHQGLRQVLSIAPPALEMVARPADAVGLAKLANEGLAELVEQYPGHFVAGVACLPMADMDAALREAERAIQQLNLKGVQIYTPCNGKALDSPEFFPLYEMMTKYDRPIWLHPTRDADTPDYKGENHSKYRVFQTVGWPYETTVAMVRLVMSGVLERYPSLRIITHHCGGMVPFFAGRVSGAGQAALDEAAEVNVKLSRPTMEYFKMFYGDTALSGYTPGLMCGYTFFGAEHVVFGTDAPFGEYQQKIASVEQMAIPDSDKALIFEGNARRLLRLL